jgi:hypothetical protein
MSHGEQRKKYAAIFGEGDEAFSGFVGVCPKVSRDECAFRGCLQRFNSEPGDAVKLSHPRLG